MSEESFAKKYEGCDFPQLRRRDEAINQDEVNQEETQEASEFKAIPNDRQRALEARDIEKRKILDILGTEQPQGANQEGNNTAKTVERMRKKLDALEKLRGTMDKP